MVGPNFHVPPPPPVRTYTEQPLPHQTVHVANSGNAGKSQEYQYGRDIPADWWYLFHSPEINALVNAGIANNPTLAAAYASLRQAQEAANVQIGNSLFPAFAANFSASRNKTTNANLGTTTRSNIFNLYNANISVNYTLDVFGGARRQIEALRAQVDYQQFTLIAAYLTLTSNIVTTAITIAALAEQIEATKDDIEAQTNQLHILQKQFQIGAIAKTNVLVQKSLVEQTRATLPPLQKRWAQARHALNVLVGRFPSGKLPDLKLKQLYLPKNLPVSFPSMVVRQRPDVRASEALLHAATAQIGVATANLFPQFTITGFYGWQSLIASQLFSPSTNVWNIATQIAQPLFQGGALMAQRRQAIAGFEFALEQYRQAVLQGFQNVADSLRAIETDARTLEAQNAAEIAARDSLRLIQQQFNLGGVSYVALLIAQHDYQRTRVLRVQAQADRYTDTVALFQSLGGGWWHNQWCVNECLYG